MRSLLVRKQVKLNCCTVSGLRLNGESRRDIMRERVSSFAYGNCARTDAASALTPHSATALQRLPAGKQGEVTT